MVLRAFVVLLDLGGDEIARTEDAVVLAATWKICVHLLMEQCVCLQDVFGEI